MPFAGYKNFDACVAKNRDKRNPKAYCGAVKHRTEGSGRSRAKRRRPRATMKKRSYS